MSVRTFWASVSTLAIGAVAVLGLAQPASAAGANYVALGDSYSSGVGAGSYTSESGDCQRSTKSYPYLWAAANAPSSFTSVACSGATTSSVSSGQLGALSSSTTLVSVTAGGNDVGFADVMQTCVLQSEATCVARVNTAVSQAQNTLPARLDSLYSGIHTRSPQAHVVVLGYPRFYKLSGSCIAGLTENERSAINNASEILNGVIAKRAANAGFTFSSVVDEFTGHELCSGDPWLHSVTLPITNSYHPKAIGQSNGYLPAFRSVA
ncbi:MULTISPECIES: SGNH/GDSL hydrolase family protein [unclassified Streptomyces]|uniref:SGNH/GDSL hydrolase family protein n=1 Tax=Streptomyces TaxID=1883 RepID=UPI0001C1A2DE|nr:MULTISPECIES: SGNH/GDSL hydrolase family protein [unclassified Streptomyces]MYR69316.1 lipase [Streptomyces sp. SID4939]MYS01108.1 lipase [Streptomyces sp. SID4940]MYT63818.1 lipase [Streptomyces sp. SID8357]MYT86068.1 lipase [Streptomyces sp. SID8360]MYU37675.1 lipase [Streptomyces sp. SID8358]MYW38381.1 lipase [Streptomyces sp. SID1]MYX72784.1 lipase [Streptomyces sp. SID3915]